MLTTLTTPTTSSAAPAAPLSPTLAPGEPPSFRVWIAYSRQNIDGFGLSHAEAVANAVCLRHPLDIAEQPEADYLASLRVVVLSTASREEFIFFATYLIEARLELAQLAAVLGWDDVDQSLYQSFINEHRTAREALAFG